MRASSSLHFAVCLNLPKNNRSAILIYFKTAYMPEHGRLNLFENQAALHISGIRLTDRRIGAEFYGRTLYKRARGHYDLILVARHIPRFGQHMAFHRGHPLNVLAERYKFLSGVKAQRLNYTAPLFMRQRTDPITQAAVYLSLIHI